MKKEESFIDVFKKLMLNFYPDCNITKDKKLRDDIYTFHLSSKYVKKIEVCRASFYLDLEVSEIKNLDKFNKNENSLNIPALNFGIKLSSNLKKSYSYPKLRNHLGSDIEDVFLTASYIFTCVNYTIHFFENEINT